jgi:hypothetical protein
MSWGRLAELYLRAKAAAKRCDLEPLKQFYQRRLAPPWRDYQEDFRLEITPSGYRLGETWEIAEDAGDDYLAQMDSEQRVRKGGKWLWERIGKRPNHYWDCEAMQVAAAVMLKLVGQESVRSAAGEGDEPAAD